MNLVKIGLLFSFAVVFTSCDAINQLHYVVKNKTTEELTIKVPNYPVNYLFGVYSVSVDTIITLLPNQTLLVGVSPTDINFPWATKKIYKKTPGICDLAIVEQDTLIQLNCSNAVWRYKNKTSILTLKNR
jgi:hypothetical protein